MKIAFDLKPTERPELLLELNREKLAIVRTGWSCRPELTQCYFPRKRGPEDAKKLWLIGERGVVCSGPTIESALNRLVHEYAENLAAILQDQVEAPAFIDCASSVIMKLKADGSAIVLKNPDKGSRLELALGTPMKFVIEARCDEIAEFIATNYRAWWE